VVGSYQFRARVEDAGPELTREDNVSTAEVKVVRPADPGPADRRRGPRPTCSSSANALMRDPHVEFAAWLQHADPGFRQPGDRPIARLPNDEAELRRYDALLLVDPDMRALGPQWPDLINAVRRPGRRRPDLRRRRAPFAAALRRGRRGAGRVGLGTSWTKVLPIVRESGLFRTEAEVRLTTRSTYSLDLTPEGRGDPIFAFHPDPIRNRAILTSLPGMYWSFPVTRARPGATVLARHGDPRMQNQHGRHVLLASQLYGPGRTSSSGSTAPTAGVISRKITSTASGSAPDRPGGTQQGRPGGDSSRSRCTWAKGSTGSATR